MRLRLILFSLLLSVGAFAQLGIQQPFFLQSAAIDPCVYFAGPIDDFTNYTALANLDGLNGGCHWNGPYVAHTYENVPGIWHQDDMDSYVAGSLLAGSAGGMNWFTAYVVHSYEDLPGVRYVDAFSERATDDSIVSGSYAGGTNYSPAFAATNTAPAVAWTNFYIGKGY